MEREKLIERAKKINNNMLAFEIELREFIVYLLNTYTNLDSSTIEALIKELNGKRLESLYLLAPLSSDTYEILSDTISLLKKHLKLIRRN